MFTSSVIDSVEREATDVSICDEGIAPAIAEEQIDADGVSQPTESVTEEVNKAEKTTLEGGYMTGTKKEEWRGTPPYLFVLKEGPEFEKNLFDYSLCIMQIKPETFGNSPSKIIITARNKYDTKLGSNPK